MKQKTLFQIACSLLAAAITLLVVFIATSCTPDDIEPKKTGKILEFPIANMGGNDNKYRQVPTYNDVLGTVALEDCITFEYRFDEKFSYSNFPKRLWVIIRLPEIEGEVNAFVRPVRKALQANKEEDLIVSDEELQLITVPSLIGWIKSEGWHGDPTASIELIQSDIEELEPVPDHHQPVFEYKVTFWHADRNATVKGIGIYNDYDVNLKKGWNLVAQVVEYRWNGTEYKGQKVLMTSKLSTEKIWGVIRIISFL